MYVRPKLAGLFVALVPSAALLLSGCSSSQPRDINYNTDVAVGFVPTDVAPMSASHDGAASEAGTSEAAPPVDSQISVDSADAMDVAMDVGISTDSTDDVDIEVAVDTSIDGDS